MLGEYFKGKEECKKQGFFFKKVFSLAESNSFQEMDEEYIELSISVDTRELVVFDQRLKRSSLM